MTSVGEEKEIVRNTNQLSTNITNYPIVDSLDLQKIQKETNTSIMKKSQSPME